MRRLRKIKENKGETIVEVLCAILIGGLAAGLLMSCFTASRNMAQKAKGTDTDIILGITEAENQTTAISGLKIKISCGSDEKEFDINAYGGNNVYSFK